MMLEPDDDLQRELGRAIEECQKFLFITRGIEFQEQANADLKTLLERIRNFKRSAIDEGSEERANSFLFYEFIIQSFFELLNMWIQIKYDEMDQAWDSLVNAQMAVRHALLVREDDQLHKLNNRLHLIEDAIFPRPMFMKFRLYC